MKTLSIISYVIGSILLIISCFSTSTAAIWWFGVVSLVFLITGCVFQFNATKREYADHSHTL